MLGFRRVACFSDSSEVVKMVETGVSHFHHYGNQIAVIRQLINRNWHVELHHIFRGVTGVLIIWQSLELILTRG